MPSTQSGNVYPFNGMAGTGSDVQAALSSSFLEYGAEGTIIPEAGTPTTTDTATNTPPKISTLWYLGSIVLLIVILKFAMEHEKSGMEPSFVGIGVYNFIAVGLMALLFIVLAKVIVNKWQVPGLTHVINAS